MLSAWRNYKMALFGDLYFLGKKDRQFQNGEIESCKFSSWCRFPVYEVDFGMVKPSWCVVQAFVVRMR